VSRQPPPGRAEFKVWRKVTTRWADNDAYGHVNNTVYYEWFDTAVNRWLVKAGLLDIERGDPIGLVAQTGCSYFAPLAFPDDVEVGIAIERLGASSVTYRIGVFAAGAMGADRFHREIRVTAALQHPNILPVFDSGRSAGQSWYTMPFVADESLRRRLEREGALPLTEAVRLAREVAGALAYAHAHGVVHRDIKPENILLSGGHALVADFGVAHVAGPADTTLTGPGAAVGSVGRAQPRLFAREARVQGIQHGHTL
jgi:YbgC/YbaW family acyl-CoA thioester hydrolase